MTQDEAEQILEETRGYYKQGFKSSNKMYVLNNQQQQNAALVTKATKRNVFRALASQVIRASRSDTITSDGTAGNCGEMSETAAEKARALGGTALIGSISYPGDHAFCAVDYAPHGGSPLHVQDMYKDDRAANSWVIDPWMNIACRFRDYPAYAAMKLTNWSSQGKQILYHRGASDPLDNQYIDGFFKNGPLTFQ